jgi:hypothetical protein
MHRNAPLTPEGRWRPCHRIQDGRSITVAAESMGISRQAASKWWGRYTREGIPGLIDRFTARRAGKARHTLRSGELAATGLQPVILSLPR